MKHNKVMYAGAVISLASPKAASLSPSKPSISQLASLLAAPQTQTVPSFLSRKIAPTKNVPIFLWTIPGIPGTSRTEEKKCAHSIEMCAHAVGQPPKGCICTQWNSGMRGTAIHQHWQAPRPTPFLQRSPQRHPFDLAQEASGVGTSPSFHPNQFP